MVNPQLLDYIRQQLASNVSKEEISKALISSGWQVTDINEAFASVAGPTSVFQSAAPTLGTQMSGQATVQPVVSGHKGLVWAVAIGLLVLVGAGGAFAAYQTGLFTSSATVTTASSTPLATSADIASTTTTTITTASSTETSSSTDVTSNNPSAKFTINNATSVIGSASTFTLRWSSTNADKFSKMESISGCSDQNLDLQNMAINAIPTPASGADSFSFAANDLPALAGCDMRLTFIAENTKTGKKAQAAINILFPKSTTATISPFRSLAYDNAIKSDLRVIQGEASIYYYGATAPGPVSTGAYTYGTPGTSCTSSNGIFTNTTIISALADIKTVQNISGSAGTSIACNNSATAYAVSSKLFSTRTAGTPDYWCVDATGGSSESTTVLGSAMVCPTPN